MKFQPKNWDFGRLCPKNQMTAKITLNLHRFQMEVVSNKWRLCTALPKKCFLNCSKLDELSHRFPMQTMRRYLRPIIDFIFTLLSSEWDLGRTGHLLTRTACTDACRCCNRCWTVCATSSCIVPMLLRSKMFSKYRRLDGFHFYSRWSPRRNPTPAISLLRRERAELGDRKSTRLNSSHRR